MGATAGAAGVFDHYLEVRERGIGVDGAGEAVAIQCAVVGEDERCAGSIPNLNVNAIAAISSMPPAGAVLGPCLNESLAVTVLFTLPLPPSTLTCAQAFASGQA